MQKSDWYLAELRQELVDAGAGQISISTTWRYLARANVTHKKVVISRYVTCQLSKKAKERNEIEGRNFTAHMAQYEHSQVVSVDESSFNNKTATRNEGWSYRGKRANIFCIFVRGKRYTLEMAISSSGYVAYKIYEGAMDGDDFLEFLEHVLVCQLRVNICSYPK